MILLLRGGIPRPIGDFPESLSQASLAGMYHVHTPGLHNKIPAYNIFARGWVAQEPFFSSVVAKNFQGLGSGRGRSCALSGSGARRWTAGRRGSSGRARRPAVRSGFRADDERLAPSTQRRGTVLARALGRSRGTERHLHQPRRRAYARNASSFRARGETTEAPPSRIDTSSELEGTGVMMRLLAIGLPIYLFAGE